LISITEKPIDVNKLLDYVSDQSSGASVLFTGTVRDHNKQDKVSKLHYEAYQEMAEKIFKDKKPRHVKQYFGTDILSEIYD